MKTPYINFGSDFLEGVYSSNLCDTKLFPEILEEVIFIIFHNLKEVKAKNTLSLVDKTFNRIWTPLVTKIVTKDNCSNEDLLLLASKFTNVTSLNLQSNKKITKGISHFKKLIYLDLSADFNLNLSHDFVGSPLVQSNEIANLTNLITLKLFCNGVIDDSGVYNLINLTELNLEGNEQITDEGIRNLTKLKSLNLCAHRLNHFENYNIKITDAAFSNFTNLNYLNLKCNRSISNLSIIKNICLTNLNLAGNKKITNEGIEKLNLIDLDLSGNFTITNDAVVKLTNLVYLNLNLIIDDCRKHAECIISNDGISELINQGLLIRNT
ncbi:MAG: hypothetical protein H0T62_00075 [Parachlamydiaceae bacterium]|nr:hypothetical protein [Parachlamydiaceae bacterium]